MVESVQNLIIIDVRTEEEYRSKHIKKAINIPLPTFNNSFNKFDKFEDILLYCGTGKRSTIASIILIENEFVKVYNMLDGVEAWEDLGYPLVYSSKGEDKLSDSDSELEKIKDAISKKKAKWKAEKTSVSKLSFEERKRLFGAKFHPILKSTDVLTAPLGQIPFGTYDWRDINGTDWITPIRDQESCGWERMKAC